MSQEPETMPSRNLPISAIVGAIFSFIVGGLALVLGILGLVGKGGSVDILTAIPNLITGAASTVGAAGYLALKKWAIPVYAVAAIGHFISHGMLFVSHGGAGHVSMPGIVSLLIIPVLALIVLIGIERHRRQGLLV